MTATVGGPWIYSIATTIKPDRNHDRVLKFGFKDNRNSQLPTSEIPTAR